MLNNSSNIIPLIDSDYYKNILPLVKNSKRSIKILIYTWNYYPDDPACDCQLFNFAIIEAKKRGVEISVITNQSNIIPYFLLHKIDIKKIYNRRLLHSKIVIIDDEYLLIGSHNLTESAFNFNHEASLLISFDPVISYFSNYFDNLFKR